MGLQQVVIARGEEIVGDYKVERIVRKFKLDVGSILVSPSDQRN